VITSQWITRDHERATQAWMVTRCGGALDVLPLAERREPLTADPLLKPLLMLPTAADRAEVSNHPVKALDFWFPKVWKEL